MNYKNHMDEYLGYLIRLRFRRLTKILLMFGALREQCQRF